MRKYAFVFSAQWIAWFALCCVAAVVCVLLAHWQMSRNDHLVEENQKITGNYDAPAFDAARGLPLFADYDDSLTWHPVTLQGRYAPEDTVLVRNRPHNGQVGYQVLVPLHTDQGPVIAVDRGWIPTGSHANGMPDAVPAPPRGEVTVTVRLRPGEPRVDRDAPAGQIASIDLAELASRWSGSVATGGYGQLALEDPAVSPRPEPAAKPEINHGPHLSYSLQWYAFAVLVFVAYGYAARQHVRNLEWDREYARSVERELARFYDDQGRYIGEGPEENVIRRLHMADDMPAHLRSLYRPQRTRRKAGPSNEDEEDAALDAWQARAGR